MSERKSGGAGTKAGRLFIALAVLVLVGGGLGVLIFPVKPEGILSVRTDNYANRRLEFYYFIPPSLRRPGWHRAPYLICLGEINQRGEKFVGPRLKAYAAQHGLVIVAPSFVFDDANWSAGQSYQYAAYWSGPALLDAVSRASWRGRVKPERFFLLGFSAGAQFVLRFALWRPQSCAACCAFSSGGRIVPKLSSAVKFCVGVGSADLPGRVENAEIFYREGRRIGVDVTRLSYDGLGHAFTAAQLADALRFFDRVRQKT